MLFGRPQKCVLFTHRCPVADLDYLSEDFQNW